MAKTKKSKISSASDVMRYRPKPTLRVDSTDLKTIKDFKVGDTRTFLVTAKVVSIRQGDEYGGEYEGEADRLDKTTRATLRITKVIEKK